MDDFKVMLGLDFLGLVKALASPYSSAMHIMEKGAACVVPMFGGTSSTETLSSMRLSGMRLVKRVEEEKAKKDKGEHHTRRRPRGYSLGNLVLVKTLRKEHKRLVRRYERPFPVMVKVGKSSYKVQLPPKSNIQPVFHVSLLAPHYVGMQDRRKSHRTPTAKGKSYAKVSNGCSDHMTAYRNAFLDMDNFFKSHMKLRNNALVEAKGKGTIDVQTNEGSIFIRDVLLVPELDQSTSDLIEAVRHLWSVMGDIHVLRKMDDDEVLTFAKKIAAPYDLLGRLPVVRFAGGRVATPEDAALMMELGCDGVFVSSGVFKSGDPVRRGV
ncbi:hypothetical protein RJ640_009786 [Escallonia rubra]|uniref:pyridoxal 5'-phosphate synthase (glutamine hydrolyzing) n=1 Tax=Escallonia rubra TaxID=112253 RepID=A0AA88URW9_9ASTE|nr:hypothetical protein RJ640_009786 [Escallonia rubra]